MVGGRRLCQMLCFTMGYMLICVVRVSAFSVPGSACHVDKRFVVHAAHGPTRGRGDARLARRLSHPVRQPGQTLTSSIRIDHVLALAWFYE
eukprot:scaffold18961_cov95-Phaeocystis_antarctica.AAC.5